MVLDNHLHSTDTSDFIWGFLNPVIFAQKLTISKENSGCVVFFCKPKLFYIYFLNVYLMLISRLNEKSGPLLEDSPGQSVYTQLQALAKHNPAFLLSLNSIITR